MTRNTMPAPIPAGENVRSPWGGVSVDQPQVISQEDVGGVAAAGPALSIVFNQCNVILEDQKGPLSQVCIGSLSVPISPAPGNVFSGMTLTARGSIIKSPGSRAILLLDAAGQYRTVEFPFGQQTSRLIEVGQTLCLTPALLEGEISCAITLTLIAYRLTVDEHVMLSIDSLDATALFDSVSVSPLR